jgi:hypothetical protein
MWAGFVRNCARETVRDRVAGADEFDKFLVHGDDMGSFLAWWWQSDPDTAVRFLGEYVTEIRKADPLRHDKSVTPISLDDILSSLPMALSIRLSRAESDAFIARAETELAS